MKVKIEFSTTNACFEDDFEGTVSSILGQAGVLLHRNQLHEVGVVSATVGRLFDVNGNAVGCVRVEDEG